MCGVFEGMEGHTVNKCVIVYVNECVYKCERV